MKGGATPGGETVICTAMLLLSRATGIVQLTIADEFFPRFTRISEGQLMNTGGATSAGKWSKTRYNYYYYYYYYSKQQSLSKVNENYFNVDTNAFHFLCFAMSTGL